MNKLNVGDTVVTAQGTGEVTGVAASVVAVKLDGQGEILVPHSEIWPA